MTHGWPGPIAEFLGVIGPLTDPRAHGGDPRDAFDLVIPSLPGFGFSGPTTERGWDFYRIANAWAELMARLGYGRYGAQGGDFGALVSPELGNADPEHVVGVHVNAATVGFIPWGAVDPAELATSNTTEQARLARRDHFLSDGNGYFQMHATRPQTIAYSLTDSPAGLLVWMVDKFNEWTHGPLDGALDHDQILTNVSIYWLTRTAGSAAGSTMRTCMPRRAGDDLLHDAGRGRRVRRGPCHPPLRRAGQSHRPLVGLRPGWPLRSHGGPGPAGRRCPGLLPPAPLTRLAEDASTAREVAPTGVCRSPGCRVLLDTAVIPVTLIQRVSGELPCGRTASDRSVPGHSR